MKKIVKIMGIILIFVLISYINHRIQLSKEDKLFVPIGKQVKVNGYMMNVYTEGNGEITMVFMSGGGTSSPVLDFKSLYSQMSDEYRVVVIEKIGYGFSDVADVDRDIDSILSDTRQALKQADIQGPFVLCPHSMSGIEAIYWAQTYPNEVIAIIGLDMAVPKAYETYNINLGMVKFGKLIVDTGIIRWIPSLAESDAIKYGSLTDAEKELYKVVFYRRTATKTMINELKQIKKNAALVTKNGDINVPTLIFSSNGQGTGWNKEEWSSFQSDFIENCSNGAVIELESSHYVHDIEYKKIAEEIKRYLTYLLPYIPVGNSYKNV